MKIIRPVEIVDAVLVDSSVAENDHAAYSGATTYAAGDRVISTATHRIYESLQSGNLGNALPVSPATSTAWWNDVGATNRWKMFDSGVETQSSRANEITVELEPGRVDSVAMLNIEADTYRVMLESGVDTVYDSGTVSLVLGNAVGDWYQYFFEEIRRQSDKVLTDIPPYTDGVLTITLAATGGTVKLGMLVVGLYRDLGETQWRPRIGINDYSRKEVDDFGNVVVVERAFSKRFSGEAFVRNELIDEVTRVMAEYRATPVVWVGDETYTSTIVYGFYKSFEAVIDSPAGSLFSLEVEGLK